MNIDEQVKNILINVLQIEAQKDGINGDTPLLGNIPELDSMAVVNLITTMEDHFGIAINDDEISAETFATLNSLSDFVRQKLA
jgi:acyl carrier protein